MLSACAHWVILPFDKTPNEISYFDANSVKYANKQGQAYAEVKLMRVVSPKVKNTFYVIKKETYNCKDKTKSFTAYLYIHNVPFPKSETIENEKVSLDENTGSSFLFKKLCKL